MALYCPECGEAVPLRSVLRFRGLAQIRCPGCGIQLRATRPSFFVLMFLVLLLASEAAFWLTGTYEFTLLRFFLQLAILIVAIAVFTPMVIRLRVR